MSLRSINIHQNNNQYFDEYDAFCYGFFGVICLALGIVVHMNQGKTWYADKLEFLYYKLDSLFVYLSIYKDEPCLPLYNILEKNINTSQELDDSQELDHILLEYV